MGMHYFPLALDQSEQECLAPGLIKLVPIFPDLAFDACVGDRPGKAALEMNFDIREIEVQIFKGIFLRFHMVGYQVVQSFILTAGLYIAGAFKIEEVLSERCPITVFPTIFDGGDDLFDRFFVINRRENGR